MTSGLSGLPVILPISSLAIFWASSGLVVDALVRRHLTLEELLHDVGVLVEELGAPR